ncbi:sulfite exporter TauE/SafE family protein [Taibaiella koreensis]|uniref:sulfite exporter TauE/SafE family protein n=1 Tax=Taibaiella koreensis TaxID=1268548 RepID=UPI000E5A0D30|nr:sulfite exporter TauE/SafE family protein [Taibaiella koreensis]
MFTVFVLVFLTATLAFMLSAVCGGGAGLLLLPVLGIWLPAGQVPAALSLGTFSSSATRLKVFYRSVDGYIVRRFVPAAIPAAVLGAWLLRYLNPVYLSLLMGLFLVSNLPFLFRKKAGIVQRSRPHSLALLAIGLVAGFLSGLTGAVGLIFNRFYFRYGLSKEEIVATRAANELLLHLVKLALYLAFGLLPAQAFVIGLAVALAGIVSAVVLKRGLARVSESLFRRMGYLAMVASGLLMLYQSGGQLMRSKNAYFSFHPVNKGTEATLQWQGSKIAFEFSWNDGLEYEHTLPLNALTPDRQKHVLAAKGRADQVVVEEVRSLEGRSYEAYYFIQGRLIAKIDFK